MNEVLYEFTIHAIMKINIMLPEDGGIFEPERIKKCGS